MTCRPPVETHPCTLRVHVLPMVDNYVLCSKVARPLITSLFVSFSSSARRVIAGASQAQVHGDHWQAHHLAHM